MSHNRRLAGALICLGWWLGGGGAFGQPAAPQPEHGVLSMDSGTGETIILRAPAANIFIADPKVVDVHPASPGSLFIFGVSPGRTTVATTDSAGHLIAQYEVTVHPSQFGALEAQAAIARLVTGSQVKAQPQPRGILLTGQVHSASDAAQAINIARGYLAENQVIEDQLTIGSATQVTLRVRIAEMDRAVVQNLGINWQALGTIGSIATFPALNLAINAGVVPACTAIGIAACQGVNFNGVIDALAQDNLARVLAEPNLTVISGQAASFLVGGEYPIPVGQGNGQVTIAFKKYGISLSFLPTILSDGRINLHVNPEISELTSQGAVQLTAGNSSIQVPALTIRSAESTVELGSGQSFALAGLLEDTTTQSVVGLPFLQDLPILGTLFRSVSFQHNETELVILVTPFVVKPVDSDAQLHLPTDTYTQPTDLERILFARQVGRSQGAVPAPIRIPGDAGFIVQ